MTLQPSWHDDSLTKLDALRWYAEPELWVGDGRFLEVPGQFWGVSAIELLAAPKLERERSEAERIATARQLAGRLVGVLRGWENRATFELRYIWSGNGRLRMVLIGRCLGYSLDAAHISARQMLENSVALFPPTYNFGPLTDTLHNETASWAEIERAEEMRAPGPYVSPNLTSFYYLMHPLGGNGTGWPSLAHTLASQQSTGFVSILLGPTVMTPLERTAVDKVASMGLYLSQPYQDYDFFGNQQHYPPDYGAEAVHRAWSRFPANQGLLGRIGVAAPPADLHRVTSLVAGILTSGADEVGAAPAKYKALFDVQEYEAWKTSSLGLVEPRSRHEVWQLPPERAPWSLERMPYFFSEEEAAGLLMLPVPDEQGVAGIPQSRQVDGIREYIVDAIVDDGVKLGSALHHGKAGSTIVLPLTAINRHTLVVGAPGSGKTTTVLSMLLQLWRDYHIPFVVIEPKKEYRTLLGMPGLDELRVITLGNERVAPLRMNPLEPPHGVRAELHISSVMKSLKMALPMFPPQPEILAKALPRTYRKAGWDDDTTVDDGLAPPTLRDLLATYKRVFEDVGYEGEARNIGRGFAVRLESLLEGSRGKLLDTVTSSDFESLFSKPLVIEMNDIQDPDEKAVLAAFLLDRIASNAKRLGSASGTLRHVTVIEEAHRLLSKSDMGSGHADSGDSARSDSVRAFCEAIAELRSLGEGFILASQSPSQLADAAVANTGTRILHRMESSADRQVMLDDFDASPTIREAAARLRKGEAIARWPERDEAEVIQVQPEDGIDSSRPVTNETVTEFMADYRAQVAQLLPYQLCTLDVCKAGCLSKVRNAGASIAEDVGPRAKMIWEGAPTAKGDVATPIFELLASQTVQEEQAYCAAVHLSVNGDAFRLRPGVDDRPLLAKTVRRVMAREQ